MKQLKGIKQAYTQTTYGSPENNRPEARYKLPPIYDTPEPNTPDPNVSATTYGNIVNDTAVFGSSKPTAEQAAGATGQDEIARLAGVDTNKLGADSGTVTIESGEGAGKSDNFPSGTYPVNPTPMQGPGDNPATGAVMPKLQVSGDPRLVYGVRRFGKSWVTIRGQHIYIPTSGESISTEHEKVTQAGYEDAGTGLSPFSDAKHVHRYIHPNSGRTLDIHTDAQGRVLRTTSGGKLIHHTSPSELTAAGRASIAASRAKSLTKPGVDHTVIDSKWSDQTNNDPRQVEQSEKDGKKTR